MNLTKLVRKKFVHDAKKSDEWGHIPFQIQHRVLSRLLKRAYNVKYLKHLKLQTFTTKKDPYTIFSRSVPVVDYEDMRDLVMRMIHGERDVLWPGICRDYAQSSGTSGGRSKYIPITNDNLYRCHYKGAADCVAHYLRNNPQSRIFSGKSFILGGSFANTLGITDPKIHIGDLSATLINRINPLANLFRIPDKHTALLLDWEEKLPRLVEAAQYADITNISGVPSWFLTVIKEVMKARGTDKISEVWPNLEVFFHGGISFEPYREIYKSITDPKKMHFVETYNASEGFFAVQNDPDDHAMLLLIDNDVFYEFIDIFDPTETPKPIWEIEKDKVYELVITSSNGLWRYRLGDTVRIDSLYPVKIRIAGRTKTFINAFGEELMEDNAERAIAEACRQTGAEISNYTAAPVYATDHSKGRHQWIMEWSTPPGSIDRFAEILDEELRKANSDYDAKRSHTIFLDPPQITTVPQGTFNKWLSNVGSGKLGGQRKVPRLSNDRKIADEIMSATF